MARWSGAFTRALLVGTESTQWKYHDPANSYWTTVEERYTLMAVGGDASIAAFQCGRLTMMIPLAALT